MFEYLLELGTCPVIDERFTAESNEKAIEYCDLRFPNYALGDFSLYVKNTSGIFQRFYTNDEDD